MIEKKTIEKYEVLFQSGVEFAHRVGLCEVGDVEGCNDEEIVDFCNRNNTSMPAALWAHTRHFGRKAIQKDTQYNIALSLNDYEFAIHQANLREEWHEMMTVKEFLKAKNLKINFDYDYPLDSEGLYTPEITSVIDIDSIITFSYDEYSRSFKFLDSTVENPIIYYLTRYYALASSFETFTDTYRKDTFMYVLKHAPYGFAQLGLEDGKTTTLTPPRNIDYSDGFDFLRFYEELTKSDNYNRIKLMQMRETYNIINSEKEQKENRILSGPEFEADFISFLTERGMIP